MEVHDVGLEAQLARQGERGARQEREALRVVDVVAAVLVVEAASLPVVAVVLEEVGVGAAEAPVEERGALAPRVHGVRDALEPVRGEIDGAVARRDDGDVVAALGERRRERPRDVAQAAGLRVGRHLGGDEQDLHRVRRARGVT